MSKQNVSIIVVFCTISVRCKKMDDLTQAQAEGLKKISTERLRSRLVKIGYEEDLIFATERSDLLTMLVEYI